MPDLEEQKEMVVLPHFTAEEVEALRQEQERREQAFKGRALLDNDEERVRDAIQRGNYWTTQTAHLVNLGHSPYTDEMRHAQDQLAECLHVQGNIEGALQIVSDPERKAQIDATLQAIQKDDGETCDCPENAQIVGRYPSAKHGGRLVAMKRCPSCGDLNITDV